MEKKIKLKSGTLGAARVAALFLRLSFAATLLGLTLAKGYKIQAALRGIVSGFFLDSTDAIGSKDPTVSLLEVFS